MKSGVWIVVALVPALLAGCGAAGVDTRAAPVASEVPALLEVVCHEDGSTELVNQEVRAMRDGVHIQVDNRAGEFVSINGAGLDFSEGITEQEARTPPGELKIACWPGTKHTEPEPERHEVMVHDADGYWVPAELECPRDEAIASSILDYASGGSGTHGNPEDLARKMMNGIRDDDTITTVGYPEAEPREVAVERDEETIALVSFDAARQGGWFLGSYSACPSAGIEY